MLAALKRTLSDDSQRLWSDEALNASRSERLRSYLLYAVWERNILETVTPTESPHTDYLQRALF